MKRYSAQEAEEVLISHAPSLEAERVAVRQAVGRVLSEDVPAGAGLPAFDQSAVDGYAVLPSDGTSFRLAGEIYAGDRAMSLRPGEAVFVATGAPVPPGSGVVMKEQVEVAGDTVRMTAPAAGTNVRLRGEEVQTGASALRAGCRVGPGEMALLLALGTDEVTVRRPIRALLISTGSELREGDEKLAEGLVRNTNGPWLTHQLSSLGAETTGVLVPDDRETFVLTVRERMDHADIVLSTGGISVGPKDFVAHVAEALGLQPLIRGVGFRPAYPLSAFGREGGPIWVALPGNPLATALGFDRLVRPLVAAMEGRPSEARWSRARLVRGMPENHSDYERYWPTVLSAGSEGLLATPASYAASSSVSALCSLGGWVLRASDAEEAKAGDEVRCWLGAGLTP